MRADVPHSWEDLGFSIQFAGALPCGENRSASASGRESLVFVYIGSYTESPDGSGEGIAVFRFDAASGRLTLVQTVTGVANPSFAVLDSRQRCLYKVT